MPRISEFYGIVVAMYYDDHAPPHFHVVYAEHEAAVQISNLELLEGELPARSLRLVREWAALHRNEIERNWERARDGLPLDSIPPLEYGCHMLRIRTVAALEGFRLRLGLTDGSERVVDVSDYLRGPIFEPLRADRALFIAVRVDPVLGTVVWPNGADIDPDVLIHGRRPAALEIETRS